MTPADRLTHDDVDSALGGLPGWSREGDIMGATYRMPTFSRGIDLVTRAASAAEAANHHPDMDIRWRSVSFRLTTHDAGGITALDLALARSIHDAAVDLGWLA